MIRTFPQLLTGSLIFQGTNFNLSCSSSENTLSRSYEEFQDNSKKEATLYQVICFFLFFVFSQHSWKQVMDNPMSADIYSPPFESKNQIPIVQLGFTSSLTQSDASESTTVQEQASVEAKDVSENTQTPSAPKKKEETASAVTASELEARLLSFMQASKPSEGVVSHLSCELN
jgi:hypothetical protein